MLQVKLARDLRAVGVYPAGGGQPFEKGAPVDSGPGQEERGPALVGQGRVLQVELAGDLRAVGVHFPGGGQPAQQCVAINPGAGQFEAGQAAADQVQGGDPRCVKGGGMGEVAAVNPEPTRQRGVVKLKGSNHQRAAQPKAAGVGPKVRVQQDVAQQFRRHLARARPAAPSECNRSAYGTPGARSSGRPTRIACRRTPARSPSINSDM